jgi:hypothetical protein
MYADDAGDLDRPAEQGVIRRRTRPSSALEGANDKNFEAGSTWRHAVAFEFQRGGFTYATARAAAFVEMPTLETTAKVIHFELLLDDYHRMVKHAYAASPSERVLSFAAIFIATFAGMAFFGRDGRVFLAGMWVGIFGLLVRLLHAQHRLRPQRDGAWLCRYDVQLTPSGARVQTPNWTCDVPWRGILAVEETAAHCFLRIDTASVYTIPKRSFPNGEAMRQFIDFARDCVSRAKVA